MSDLWDGIHPDWPECDHDDGTYIDKAGNTRCKECHDVLIEVKK